VSYEIEMFDAKLGRQVIEMYRKMFKHEITFEELQVLKAKLPEEVASFSDEIGSERCSTAQSL